MSASHSNWKSSYEMKTNRQKITLRKTNNTVEYWPQVMRATVCFYFMGQRDRESPFWSTNWSAAQGPCQQLHTTNRIKHSASKTNISSLLFMAFLRTYFYSVFEKSVSFLRSQQHWITIYQYETTYQPATIISLSLHGHIFASLYLLIVSVSLHMFEHFSKLIIQCQVAVV